MSLVIAVDSGDQYNALSTYLYSIEKSLLSDVIVDCSEYKVGSLMLCAAFKDA